MNSKKNIIGRSKRLTYLFTRNVPDAHIVFLTLEESFKKAHLVHCHLWNGDNEPIIYPESNNPDDHDEFTNPTTQEQNDEEELSDLEDLLSEEEASTQAYGTQPESKLLRLHTQVFSMRVSESVKDKHSQICNKLLPTRSSSSTSATETTSTSFALASLLTRVASIKFTKRYGVSEWVSQLVTSIPNDRARVR